MNENESLTVTLTLGNNEELECAVLNIFEADEKEYIALLPLDENGDNTDGQIYLYRFIDNGEEEEPGLENIEEDEGSFHGKRRYRASGIKCIQNASSRSTGTRGYKWNWYFKRCCFGDDA